MPTPIWPPSSQVATAATYKTINLTNIVPANAAAVMLCPVGSIGGGQQFTAKPTGQPEAYSAPAMSIADGRGSASIDIICKIGNNRSIDVYSGTAIGFAIFAYFTAQEVRMLDVAQRVNFTQGTANWQTVNLTSYLPPGTTRGYGAFISVIERTTWNTMVGWRRNGQTGKTITNPSQGYVGTAFVPMDELNQVQLYANSTSPEFWIHGVVTASDAFVYHETPRIARRGTAIPDNFIHYKDSFCGIYEGTTNGVRDNHTQVTPQDWPIAGRGTRNYGYRTYPCVPYGDPANKEALPTAYSNTNNSTIYEIGYWVNPKKSALFFGTNF